MSNYKLSLEKKLVKKNVEIQDVINTFIQPFKQMPSVNNRNIDCPERINAHDLFSFYTADIIKEDIVFVR